MIKINLKRDQKLFLTSDTHYNHKNIVKGVSSWSNKDGCRDFKTISEMNDTLVNNINKVVGIDDILIHNGDWSFGGADEIARFRRRILCKNIYLLLGNHDDHIANNVLNSKSLFTWVGEQTVIQVTKYNDVQNEKAHKYMFLNQHYPQASWRDMKYGVIHLFGHLHSDSINKLMPGKQMDIGVDGNNFMPYSLDDILNIMNKQPIKGLINHDHHG